MAKSYKQQYRAEKTARYCCDWRELATGYFGGQQTAVNQARGTLEVIDTLTDNLVRGLPDGTAQPDGVLVETIANGLTAGLEKAGTVGYTDVNSELKQYPKEGEPYQYTGTREHVAEIAAALPEQDDELLRRGWEDISHPNKRSHGFHVYRESSTGLKIQFDVAKQNTNGEVGRNHYHIFNPDVHNYDDKYLDVFGNPVAKGTEESHIFPKGG